MLRIHWERWKKYPLDKRYKVSSDGRIKYKGKILKEYIDNNAGYKLVHINGQLKRVHIVVATTYLGKVSGDRLTVDHIDSNKRNNAVSNLDLVTEEENLKRAQEKLAIICKAKNLTYGELKAVKKEAAEIKKKQLKEFWSRLLPDIQEELFRKHGINQLIATGMQKHDSKLYNKSFTLTDSDSIIKLLKFGPMGTANDKTSTKIANKIYKAALTNGEYGGFKWDATYNIVNKSNC